MIFELAGHVFGHVFRDFLMKSRESRSETVQKLEIKHLFGSILPASRKIQVLKNFFDEWSHLLVRCLPVKKQFSLLVRNSTFQK